MTTIQMIPTSSTQPLEALDPMPPAPKSKKTYCPAIWARLAITRMSAADDAPAAEPARLGAEGPGAPGEGGAAVGVGVVQLLVGVGDEQHRDEGEDRDDRGLQAVDGDDDEAERRRQAVGRRRRRHAHHHRGDQPERPSLQPLVAGLLASDGRIEMYHVPPLSQGCGWNPSERAADLLCFYSLTQRIPAGETVSRLFSGGTDSSPTETVAQSSSPPSVHSRRPCGHGVQRAAAVAFLRTLE